MPMPSLFDDPDHEIEVEYHELEEEDADSILEDPPLEEDQEAPAVTVAPVAALEDSVVQPPLPGRYARLADLRIEYRLWVNPRSITGLDEAKIAELGASIRERTVYDGNDGRVVVGVTDPLQVVRIRNAKGGEDILIIDGQRRYLAAASVFRPPGDELVPVVDLEPDPVEWTQELSDRYFAQALHGVGTREGLSAYELSDAALRLRESKDPETKKSYTMARIAGILNRSESWVSKILTARGAASDKLLTSWRRGEITEEQFRDLAAVKDKTKQSAKIDDVTSAGGERGASRAVAKQERLIARQAEKAEKPATASKALQTETKGKKTTVVRGPQAPLPLEPDKPQPSAKKPRPMPMAVIDDVLSTANKYPPTHDMVRGIVLGIRVAAGLMDAADLPKPWQAYLGIVAAAQSRGRKPNAKPQPPSAKSKKRSKK